MSELDLIECLILGIIFVNSGTKENQETIFFCQFVQSGFICLFCLFIFISLRRKNTLEVS